MAFKVVLQNINDLIEYEDNPRKNEEAVSKVADSINTFGFKTPIVVDEDNIILAGHTRLKAAKLLGMKKVPVHVASDLSEEQKRAYRIMDNKSGEAADWDNDLLSKEFQNLAETDFDMMMTGFGESEIQKLTSDILEFEPAANANFDENFASLDDVQQSNVRMVNLFLNTETEPVFQEMVGSLKEKWAQENLTDTVYEAIKRCYENTNT
jgi:ParB-like chromosome segregation protein Spo0J